MTLKLLILKERDEMNNALKILKILLVFMFINSCASIVQMPEEMREVEVIKEHNLKQDEAFIRTVRWVATNFRSANDVIQLQDRETGAIVVNGTNRVTRGGITSFDIRFSMTLDIRDERIRFRQVIDAPVSTRIGGITEEDAVKMHEYFESLRNRVIAYLETEDDF